MDEKQFAAAIRQLVKESGEKRVSIADRAGVSEASIRAVESGKCPSVVRANKILRALGRRVVIGDPAGQTVEME